MGRPEGLGRGYAQAAEQRRLVRTAAPGAARERAGCCKRAPRRAAAGRCRRRITGNAIAALGRPAGVEERNSWKHDYKGG